MTFRCSDGSTAEIEASSAALKSKVDQASIEKRSGKPELKIVKYAASVQ